MLMLLATIEVIGAYFTRQLEQNSIENFQSSIQIQTIVSNQLANQLTSDNKNTNDRLNQIVNDYNNDAISEIIVVDNKDTIRAVSNLNDKSKIGQRINNTDVKQVISTGHQINKVVDDHGNYMIQISPLTSGNGSNNTVGAIYVKASMQDVFNNLRQISLTFLIASLIAALLGAFLSLVISRAITQPIEEMQKQALHIADGDYSSQVKIYSNDELGQLAKAFNTLSVRIERSQEESDSERRRLDSVLSHMSDGVIATDRHGNVSVVNHMALNFLNKKEDEVINKPIAEVLGLEDTSSQDLISSQKEIVITLDPGTRDEIILHASFSLIKRVTGFVSGSVCVLHDVTEQQKNEDSQRQFVSNVSHELRTPISVILAEADYAQNHTSEPEKMDEAIAVISRQGEKMSRLVSELLTLARSDKGTLKINKESFNLAELGEMVLSTMEDKAAEKSISLTLKSSDDITVNADQGMLARLMINLVSNAISYGKNGGFVILRISRHEGNAVHADREDHRPESKPRSRQRGLAAGMSGADDRHIVFVFIFPYRIC